MLRSVAPIGLLLCALLLLGWALVSAAFDIGFTYASSDGTYAVAVGRSVTLAWSRRPDVLVTEPGFSRNPYERRAVQDATAWPYPPGAIRRLKCPLWLLATICLAWPVTSFILARRRPKRGFPVEVATSSGGASEPPAGAD